MENQALIKAFNSLEVTIRDLRDAMDDTQTLYHELFIRMLATYSDLQTILTQLKDAEIENRNQKQDEHAEKT